MPLNLDIREEVLLAVHLLNSPWLFIHRFGFFLNVIFIALILKVTLTHLLRKRLWLSLNRLIGRILCLKIGILGFSAPSTKNFSFAFDRLESTILKLGCLKALPHLGNLGLPLLVPDHMLLVYRRFPGEIRL